MGDEPVDWARAGLAEWLRGQMGAATLIAEHAVEEWPQLTQQVQPWFSAASFVEDNTPDDVLERIKGTSQIVDLHVPFRGREYVGGSHINSIGIEVPNVEPASWWGCELCSDADDGVVVWPCETLRWLAWGYRRSSGWQPEWAPREKAVSG